MDYTSFQGRIIFVNKESYKNFIVHRKQINNLKYNCGNKAFTHFIQHDKDVFVITTNYAHEAKQDNITEHAISYVLHSPTEERINELLYNHIPKVKFWKLEIDKIPSLPSPKGPKVKKESVWQKILKLFEKR